MYVSLCNQRWATSMFCIWDQSKWICVCADENNTQFVEQPAKNFFILSMLPGNICLNSSPWDLSFMNILWSGKYGWAHTRSQQKHSSGKFLDVRHLQWKKLFYQFQAFLCLWLVSFFGVILEHLLLLKELLKNCCRMQKVNIATFHQICSIKRKTTRLESIR